LAFHFGTGKPENRDELVALVQPFAITIVYVDNNVAYQSRSTNREIGTGKAHMQTIERKHRSLRTGCSHLVRKGIRFSKDHRMHKIGVALVITF
jgi:IS1 family transposase